MAQGKGRAPGKGFRRRKRNKLGFWTVFALLLLIGGYLAAFEYSRPHVTGEQLRIDSFVDLAEGGQIRDAKILDLDSYVVGTYDPEDGRGPRAYNTPYLKETTTRQGVLDVLLRNRVPTTIDQQNTKRTAAVAANVLPMLMLVILFAYLTVSHRRGTGLFSTRTRAHKAEAGATNATFADVAAQESAITELKEVRDFLADPERFTTLGATVPKGILLYGPPGCGKTLLARAVAGEAGAAFYSISGSDFVEMYVGVGAARVRNLFREARENAPAIVFIDELDSVGRRRKGNTAGAAGSQEEQEQALNQILAELDGFSPLEGVIVIGASNRPDILDPALLRPGRFDRTIGLDRADEKGRLEILKVRARNKPLEILKVRARNKPLDAGVDLPAIAHRAVGLSGADLAGVVNEAALLAARAGKKQISQVELETALTRTLEAPERQRRLSMRDRSFSRSGGSEERVTFADVAGVEEALDELGEVKEYLTDPQRFVQMGARPPRGFLLVGPPGCGKTLLARAVASEANAAFFSVAATEFVEVFVGEGAGRVRDLFAEARAAAPSIVFLDEIDAIGARRGVSLDGSHEREQTLNQILIELDGFDARSGVTILAASNRPEILDEALVRPGRFDRTITISLPDRRARRSILSIHAQGKPLARDVDLDAVAGITHGFSGADLANVLNEGALLSARRRMAIIPMTLIEEAVERVGMGITRSQRLSEDDRQIIAYHEVGHALVGRALPGARMPHKVSIVARGNKLGATWHLDEASREVYPRSLLIEQMAGLLGGRAAEELVFGEPGSGSADDLRRASHLAREMVCTWGMSEALGPLVLDGNGSDQHSDDVVRTIDIEVRRLLDDAYARARAVLADSLTGLHRAAQFLLERETITARELEEVAGPVRRPRAPGTRAPKRAARSTTPAAEGSR